MREVLILRYGEIFLKGRNIGFFEDILIKNIKSALSGLNFTFKKIQGRYIVSDYDNKHEIIERLKNVFGLTSLSIATEVDATELEILAYLKTIKISTKTFKVDTKRADKTFPVQSSEFSKIAGGVILDANPKLEVDVHSPQTIVDIDIRDNKKAFISFEKIKCVGGMPVGCGGEGLALLSGGLDSPVACYMINKRGMKNTYLHFYSYPYTSQQAKDKVITLAQKLKVFNGESEIIFVPFTKVQEEIHKHCDNDFMITLMRRIMFRIANQICLKNGLKAIISGECLGQVASQTIESLTSSNECAGIVPVLRPLIAFDKEETVEIARKIGTYETSILPYEDCCTVFLPKNPVIKPKLEKVYQQESRLDVDGLVEQCLNGVEIMKI